MKYFIAIFAFSAVALSAAQAPPDMMKISADCLATAKLTASPDEIHDLLHMEIPADTEPKKCFIKCFAEKTFVLEPTGKPNSTTLKGANLPKCFDKTKMTDAVITECAAKSGSTPCDTAVQVGACLYQKAGAEDSSDTSEE